MWVRDLAERPLEEGKIRLEKAYCGDADADFALRVAATELLRAGRPLPEPIAAYAIAIINRTLPRGKRGRKNDTLALRNGYIVKAVELVQARGIRATRNEASKSKDERQSGCSIVSAAFDQLAKEDSYEGFRNEKGHAFTEAAIEDIWNKRHKVHVSP